jgi:polysaccharide pyruvyl transferase WcaK-like protein
VIALLHAYSRSNAGDGLLVDLSLQRLERAGVPRSSVLVVALDPASFPDLNAIKIGTPERAANLQTLAAGASALSMTALGRYAPGETARALRQADAFVAVGGGYLRAGSAVNKVGTAINHLPQALVAARSGKPSIYLPQSVGPFDGWVGRRLRIALSRMTQVHVRDDRSFAELGDAGCVHRMPDLAVLAVGEQLESVQPRRVQDSSGPVIIARALPAAADYPVQLLELHRQVPDATWGIQAEGAASKSDRTFYEALGITPTDTLQSLISNGAGPVVSVRLHGAVQAILAGVPAIHLAYERKSWGAYQDLGLRQWLHSSRHFDPKQVATQLRELSADPEPFWTALRSRVPTLQQKSAELDASVQQVLGGVVG